MYRYEEKRQINCHCHILFTQFFKDSIYVPEVMYSGTVPVMCCNRCGTGWVLKQTNNQTVISVAQLSCHPVRQTRTAVLHIPTSQRLIEVDGLQMQFQRQVMRIGLNHLSVYAIHCIQCIRFRVKIFIL